jgi:hypothetical protein
LFLLVLFLMISIYLLNFTFSKYDFIFSSVKYFSTNSFVFISLKIFLPLYNSASLFFNFFVFSNISFINFYFSKKPFYSNKSEILISIFSKLSSLSSFFFGSSFFIESSLFLFSSSFF